MTARVEFADVAHAVKSGPATKSPPTEPRPCSVAVSSRATWPSACPFGGVCIGGAATPTVVAVCHHCERPLQDGEFWIDRAGTLRSVCRLCHAFANIWELARERELSTEELDTFTAETEELAEELARRPLRRNLPRRD